MVNLWHKYKNSPKKKRHTLHSICVGFVFFIILYACTLIFKTSLCPIKKLFGFSCFGCGLTRGFISILHLDFHSAFKHHILSVPLFFCIALYCFFAITDIVFNKNFIDFIEKQLSRKFAYIFYLLALIIAVYLNNHL